MPFKQRQVVPQAKFTCFTLGTFLTNKQTKNKDQSNKQTKAMEDHGKHLVQSNEIIKKHFNINGDSIPL